MAIQIRRGTDAQWEAGKSNIVVGEPAVTTDTERAFIGTGSGTYVELATIGDTDVTITDIKDNAFIHRTASGAIASFSDGSDMPMDSLIADINPIQNLNGYDHPWAGGGGKNKLPSIDSTQTINGITWTKNTDGSVRLSGTASANSVYDFGRGTLTLPAGTYTTKETTSGNIVITVFKIVSGSASVVLSGGGTFTLSEETSIFVRYFISSGATVSQTIYPQIESGSTATTYEPYSNICPISGWDSVDVNVSGINVWDEEWESGGLDTSGQPIASSTQIRSKNYIRVSPSSSYYVVAPSDIVLYQYDENKNYITRQGIHNATITLNVKTKYLKFRTSDAYGTTYSNDISINYPSTDTEYHPYNGNTTTVDLGQTVYGGSLNVTSGVLTIDAFYYELQGTEGFTLSGSGSSYINVNSRYPYCKGTTANDGICSHFEFGYGKVYAGTSSQTGQYITFTKTMVDSALSISTVAQFNEWLASQKANGTPVVVCYKLATPTTVQLTPTQVQTLLGQNNIWSDAGEVEITYIANASLTIEELINAITALGGNV